MSSDEQMPATESPRGTQRIPSNTNISEIDLSETIFRGNFLLNIWVPTEQVGLIIGKKGTMISKIAISSGANIDIPEPEGESAWQKLILRGSPVSVFKAYKAIEALVDEVDECVAEFQIPKNKHALIIGKDGRTIRRISADTNVRVYVPDKTQEANNNTIQLEGEVPQVCKAFQMVVGEAFRQQQNRDAAARMEHLTSLGKDETDKDEENGVAKVNVNNAAKKYGNKRTEKIEQRVTIAKDKIKLVAGAKSRLKLELEKQLAVVIRPEKAIRMADGEEFEEGAASGDAASSVNSGEGQDVEAGSDNLSETADLGETSAKTFLKVSGRPEDVRAAVAAIEKYLKHEEELRNTTESSHRHQRKPRGVKRHVGNRKDDGDINGARDGQHSRGVKVRTGASGRGGGGRKLILKPKISTQQTAQNDSGATQEV